MPHKSGYGTSKVSKMPKNMGMMTLKEIKSVEGKMSKGHSEKRKK